MKFLFSFFYVGTVSAVCIAPRTGFRTCGPCDDIRGSQCVTLEGRWFSCYTDYQQCCSDWQIRNNQPNVAQCVTDSQKAANQPTTPSPTRILPDVSDVCKQVASRGTSKTNIQCMTDCDSLVSAGGDPKTDTLFNQSCVWAHWHATNGRTVVDGPCFEKWIYGYSQENSLASFVKGLSTDTPAQCQALCQDNDACINWAWVSSLYSTSASCLLKDETMVSKALSIRTDIMGDPSMDTQYCNYGMPHECSTNHYVCLPCDGGHKRCVWESDMHVTGWKYCTPVDTCNPTPYRPIDARTGKIPTPRPTTTAPPTTPKPTTIVTTTTAQPTTTTTPPTTPKPTTEPTTTAPPTTPKPTTIVTTTTAQPTTTANPTTMPNPTANPKPISEPTPSSKPSPSSDASALTTTRIDLDTVAPTPKPLATDTVVHSSGSAQTSPDAAPFTLAPIIVTNTVVPLPATVTAGQNCPCARAEEGVLRANCPCQQAKQECSAGCICQGKPNCGCCNEGLLLIRLAEPAKKFQVNLEN